MSVESADELARAIVAGEIVPYFQPLVEMRTGRLSGFEVLARWHHPTLGIVHPATFIPLAEQTGLIGSLTERLLRRATSEAAVWPRDITLAVNISPVQLRDIGLAERLMTATEGSGFAFDRLVFEITEATLIGNHDLARTITGQLKALGATLALDDFGTGYANLRQLLALRFDKLKMDASFVRTISARESRTIVATVIGLAQGLGMITVAEGIETQEQAELLVSMGCDVGQGWLFGRPMPAELVTETLARDDPPWRPASWLASIGVDMAHRLEALPSQSIGQLRALYDNGPVGLGLVDTDLRYQVLNRRLAEMHGTTVIAHHGRAVADMIPHLYDRVEPCLRRALAGESVNSLVSRWQAPNRTGDEHVLLASYQPVRDPTAEVVGVSIAVVDVTEMDRACTAQRSPRAASQLSPRQKDVLRLLAAGCSVKQIARQLGLGVGTVKAHLTNAYRALGARNRTEAVLRAGLMVRNTEPEEGGQH